MMELQKNLDELRAELAENTRLRIGLWVILWLVLVWLSLVWSDFNRGQYNHVRQLEDDRLSLSEIESAETWRERVAAERVNLERLERILISTETAGLAQAKLQTELYELMGQANPGELVVKVGSPQALEETPGVSRVRARLAANLSGEKLLASLERIETSPELFDIERISIKKVRQQWGVELFVAAYFKIGDGS